MQNRYHIRVHDEHCARLRETVESEMLTYVLLFLVSIISPLLGLAEPICIFGATLNPNAWIWIALVVAAGQTTGFSLLLFRRCNLGLDAQIEEKTRCIRSR